MNGGTMAAIIGVVSLVVIASIAYQVLVDKNSVPLADEAGTVTDNVVTQLFK
ncbi:MAG: hypothetical protein WA634_02490 [Silvibacterium sp.]